MSKLHTNKPDHIKNMVLKASVIVNGQPYTVVLDFGMELDIDENIQGGFHNWANPSCRVTSFCKERSVSRYEDPSGEGAALELVLEQLWECQVGEQYKF